MFIPAALLRLIDADEGVYLLASKLVMQGRAPYVDFLYPQMPLLPYVYGAWMKFIGFSWHWGRMLSALCAIALGSLLYRHVAQRFRSPGLALSAVLLYTFSGLVFGWYSTVKMYSLATLCLFGAYVAVQAKVASNRGYVLGGVLFGLAVDSRLLLLGAMFAFLVWLFSAAPDRTSAVRAGLWFLAGMIGALLPNMVLLLADADAYFFNTIWYHSIRPEGRGLFGDFEQKIAVVKQLFNVFSPGGIGSLQFSVLVVLNVFYVILCRLTGRRLSLAFYIALFVAIANVLPSPTFDQYFSAIVPFLIVNGLDAISQLDQVLRSRQKAVRGTVRKGMVILVGGYVLLAPPELYRYLWGGSGVPGVGYSENAINWTISTVNSVAAELDRHVAPNEPVLTWWPGYLISSRASAVSKMETHFGLEVSPRVARDRLDRYRIMSHEEMQNILREHRTRLVVIGNWIFAGTYRETLRRSGYVPVWRIGDTEIYVWPGGKAGSPGPPSG